MQLNPPLAAFTDLDNEHGTLDVNKCDDDDAPWIVAKREKDAEEREARAMMADVSDREWGLVILDEVHVAPADTFLTCMTTRTRSCARPHRAAASSRRRSATCCAGAARRRPTATASRFC